MKKFSVCFTRLGEGSEVCSRNMRHKKSCTCYQSSDIAARQHWPLLRKLQKGGKSARKRFFKTADNCVIKYVGECCQAVLKEIIKLPEEVYAKLTPYKKELLYLADAKTRLRDKRKLLVKKGGGFLSLILPALASSLFGLIGNAVIRHYQG